MEEGQRNQSSKFLLPHNNLGDGPMTLEDKVHSFRLLLFRRAQELGNVSAACRELGVSRSLYYQLRQRFLRYGTDGLHPKRRKAVLGRPPTLDAQLERRVIAEALAQPAWGPQRISDQLARRGLEIAASTVYRALRRHGLGTRSERFGVLERHSAQQSGLLTERTRRALEKARPTPSTRHVEADRPGDLVGLDCFYIGKLKGVGRVWQITACDLASAFAIARVFVGDPSARGAARFLRHDVLPAFRRAGWTLRRVLTDRGSEFKGAFDEACHTLGIRHTRTKPRHAFTNGSVERLQQTILHEHWRVEFHRRYFTKVSHLQASLQSYLRLYNFDRPHRGYRTRGQTPASLFLGAQER
jgi:transposase InsO family protein